MHANKHSILNAEMLNHTSTAGSEDTSGMCLIDDKVTVSMWKQVIHHLDKFLDRSHVTIHAVKRLNDYKDIPSSVLNTGIFLDLGGQNVSEGRWGAMGKHLSNACPRKPHALTGTRVNQLIVHNEIPRLGNAGKNSYIGIIARVE
jgi:hypothetical protein